MPEKHPLRFLIIACLLAAGAFASITSASAGGKGAYPNAHLLATRAWLKAHLKDPNLVVVDVRDDKDLDGRVIPGAVRLSWKKFRVHDKARGLADVFIGPDAAQNVLGQSGISREQTVVLYDSVKQDGGATASYVFWALEMLGHKNVMLLERGIDGWADAGGALAAEHEKVGPVLYQAPTDELRLRRGTDGAFVQMRLGDPHYTILDVRSREEYLGQKLNKGLDGGELKAGHVPTALNVEYKLNWASSETKAFKPYAELLELYRGIDPMDTVIVYCHSGRRGSFSYFVLRLLGFEDVAHYSDSWNEWGSPQRYFPVETRENKAVGGSLPAPLKKADAAQSTPGASGGGKAKGGYVSCGG